MDYEIYSILFPHHQQGKELIWSIFEKERSAWKQERESWASERTLILTKLNRAHDSCDSLHDLHEKESEMLIERESLVVAELQKQIDCSEGLMSVRSVLEGILTTAFPSKSATDALRLYCEQSNFQSYLADVSKISGFSVGNLTKSAKSVYGMLSQIIHGGSTFSIDSIDTTIPQSVLRDKCTLNAVAAIFKFERRDIRFYVGGRGGGILKLPTPPRSSTHSVASSA